MELELVMAGTLSKEPLIKYGQVIAHSPEDTYSKETHDHVPGESLVGKYVYLEEDYKFINGRYFAQEWTVLGYED